MERLSKNIAWMTAANITGSFFTILIFIYIARVLGVEAFGRFSYAQAVVFYLSNFVDLGLTTYGIREVAKDKARMSAYVSEIISVRFLIAASLYLLFCLVVCFTGYPVGMKMLFAVTGLFFFVLALSSEWAFQGVEKMHMVFISFATTTSLQLILIYSFIKGPGDLLRVPAILFVSTLPVIIIFLRYAGFRPWAFRVNLIRVRSYLSSSLIIWSISLLTQVYNGLDIVILGILRHTQEVGYFTIARRAVGGIALLFVFMANALLPRLSHSFVNEVSQFRLATQKFLKFSMVLTGFIFIAFIVFGDRLIALTVGREYAASGLPLKIMSFGLIMLLFNLPYSTGLIAVGLEKEVLKQVAASAVLNVFLNFILIPRYGMIGASISFLAAEGLAVSWIIYIYRKKVKLKKEEK